MPGKLFVQESNLENSLLTTLAVHIRDLFHPENADDTRTILLPANSDPQFLTHIEIISLAPQDFNAPGLVGFVLYPDIPDGTTVTVQKGALVTFARNEDQVVYAFFLDNEDQERKILFQA